MDYQELNKVLASSTDEIIKFLENDLQDSIADSREYEYNEMALNEIFLNASYNSVHDEEDPLDIALSFLQMGQKNPNESFLRVYIFEINYFFRNSDLEELIKELYKEYPNVPELVRFNKKYIKQDKIKKKEIK